MIRDQRPPVRNCVTLTLNALPTPGSHQTILTCLGNVTCTPLVTTPRLARSALQALMTASSAFLQKMLKTAYGTVKIARCVISVVTPDLSPSHLTTHQTIVMKVSGFLPQSQYHAPLELR